MHFLCNSLIISCCIFSYFLTILGRICYKTQKERLLLRTHDRVRVYKERAQARTCAHTQTKKKIISGEMTFF